MPHEQTLYIFRQGQTGLCCFSATPSKKKLPPSSDDQGWTFVRTIHLKPDEKPRTGFDANEVQVEIAQKGFAIREIKRSREPSQTASSHPPASAEET